MALENFLVVLKDDISPQTSNRIVNIIYNLNGKVEIITGRGKVLIATFDNSFVDRIKKLPYVKLVGGVTIGRRRVSA
jgi:hypothetical protein